MQNLLEEDFQTNLLITDLGKSVVIHLLNTTVKVFIAGRKDNQIAMSCFIKYHALLNKSLAKNNLKRTSQF